MPSAEVTRPEVAELSIDHTDDPAAEHVEDDRAVHLSFSGWMLCDIGHPEFVRFVADEVTIDQVRWCVHGADPLSAATVTCLGPASWLCA